MDPRWILNRIETLENRSLRSMSYSISLRPPIEAIADTKLTMASAIRVLQDIADECAISDNLLKFRIAPTTARPSRGLSSDPLSPSPIPFLSLTTLHLPPFYPVCTLNVVFVYLASLIAMTLFLFAISALFSFN